MMYTPEEKAFIWLDGLDFLSYAERIKINTACRGVKNAFKNLRLYKKEISEITGADGYERMNAGLQDFEARLKKLEENKVFCVVYGTDKYPEKLCELENPPLVLYCKGNLKLLENRKRLAVVGSRRTPPNILKLTEEFTKKLSEKFVIVTGIADGADTSAIFGALESGNLISVQACGFEHVYPACNRHIFEKIIEKGLVVSEYPPETMPQKYYFPVRNRIIAGISDGVLITSGNSKSGTRHTAKYAFDLGRDVFAFPYPPGAVQGEICNNIIKEGGKLVDNLVDITTAFGINLTEKENITLTDFEKKILEILKNGEAHISKLIEITEKKAFEIQATLMTLQIKGLVADLGGNRFGIV